MTNIYESEEAAKVYKADVLSDASPPDTVVKVMTWNIKFGGARLNFFFDCIGDYHTMRRKQVTDHLAVIAQKINGLNPDIVLLQEVDVDSKRSAYVDQLQFLLDNTALNYGAYASHWRSEYIPTEELGRMDSGNGILSKWPIENATRVALPLRTDQSELTIQYYLKRNILKANVIVPGIGNLVVANVHAATYSQDDTKKRHIEIFKEQMDAWNAMGQRFVAGGDLNAQPPGSVKWTGYEDSVCTDEDFQADDHRREKEWLVAYYADYAEAIPLENYTEDNAPYFTHSVSEDVFWNRTLDYLFTNGAWQNGQVIQEGTMALSDHAPKTAELVLW